MAAENGNQKFDIDRLIDILEASQGEGLSDHELLIALLSFADGPDRAQQQADTLFQHFGIFQTIFKANHLTLERIPGISQKAIIMILLVGYLINECRSSPGKRLGECIADTQEMFLEAVDGSPNEELWAAGFDEYGILRACECVHHGDVACIQSSVAAIADFASRSNVRIISVAHNHPATAGLGASTADIKDAELLAKSLAIFDIRLKHFVIIDEEVQTLRFDDGVGISEISR